MPSRRWHHLICWLAWLLIGAGSPRDATVQVVQRGTRDINYGSGTVVQVQVGDHSHQIVLTANHVVSMGDVAEVRHNGTRYAARVLSRDSRGDVAALEFSGAVALPHVSIGQASTNLVTDSVETWGFPHSRQGGPWKLATSVVPNSFTEQWVTTRYQVEQGHSGGGMFVNGNLVSVCSAVCPPDNCTLFAPIRAVRNLVKHVTQVACRGGG